MFYWYIYEYKERYFYQFIIKIKYPFLAIIYTGYFKPFLNSIPDYNFKNLTNESPSFLTKMHHHFKLI